MRSSIGLLLRNVHQCRSSGSGLFGEICANGLRRSVFTAAGVGMDQYARIRELTAIRLGATSGDSLRKRFVSEVSASGQRSEGASWSVLSEDIKNMLYLAETEAEINAVIECIRRYHGGENRTLSNYRFGPPLMRLLSFHGKSDRAIEVFMSEDVGKRVCEDSASALILCNHLMERKRYDDVIRVFDCALKRGFVTANGMAVPSDVLMLVVEALTMLNNEQSLKKLEEIVTYCGEKGCHFTLRTVGMAVLLAIKQGQPDVGLEICGYMKQASAPLVRNLKALCFADLGRVEEAFQSIKLIIESAPPPIRDVQQQPPSPRFNQHIYPLVMKHLRSAVEKQPKFQQRLDDLVKQIYSGKNMTSTDLEEFLLTPMNRLYFSQQQLQQQQQYRPFNQYATHQQHYTAAPPPSFYQSQQPYTVPPPSFYQSQQPQNRYGSYDQNQQQNRFAAYDQNQQQQNRFAPYDQNQQQQSQYGAYGQNQQQQPPYYRQSPPHYPAQSSQPSQQTNYYQPRQPNAQFQQSFRQQQQPQQPQQQFQAYSNPNSYRPTSIGPSRPPIRSPLSGQPPNVIRSYSNPTSNRPPPFNDDEDDDLDVMPPHKKN